MEAAPAVLEDNLQMNTGPILGVQPEDLQGQTIMDDITIQPFKAPPLPEAPASPYRITEYLLLGIALFTALAALLVRRRKHKS